MAEAVSSPLLHRSPEPTASGQLLQGGPSCSGILALHSRRKVQKSFAQRQRVEEWVCFTLGDLRRRVFTDGPR